MSLAAEAEAAAAAAADEARVVFIRDICNGLKNSSQEEANIYLPFFI